MKIDAEGSELRILKGGSQFFRRRLPNVACEVNSGKLAPMGHHPSEIYHFFHVLGYEPLVLDKKGKSWETPKPEVDGDIIFLAPDRPHSS